jgi:hypothetical protein
MTYDDGLLFARRMHVNPLLSSIYRYYGRPVPGMLKPTGIEIGTEKNEENDKRMLTFPLPQPSMD